MRDGFSIGAAVSGRWGRGEGHSPAVARVELRVQRTIQGEKIVRNGTKANPAYLIETQDSHAPKLGSDLPDS